MEREKSLGDWLTEHGIIGISGVDTRELVKIIRENRDVVGRISDPEYNGESREVSFNEISGLTLAQNVSLKLGIQPNSDNKIIINDLANALNIPLLIVALKTVNYEHF